MTDKIITKTIKNGTEYLYTPPQEEVTAWFTSVTDTVYDKGRLISFVGDGVTYTLNYERVSWLLTSISWDWKTYNFKYINGTLREISEE